MLMRNFSMSSSAQPPTVLDFQYLARSVLLGYQQLSGSAGWQPQDPFLSQQQLGQQQGQQQQGQGHGQQQELQGL